jgi:hypothetical protein
MASPSSSESDLNLSSVPSSENVSVTSDKKEAIEAMILEDPMYYILNNLFETPSGKNIASCVEELCEEIREMRSLVEKLLRKSS